MPQTNHICLECGRKLDLKLESDLGTIFCPYCNGSNVVKSSPGGYLGKLLSLFAGGGA